MIRPSIKLTGPLALAAWLASVCVATERPGPGRPPRAGLGERIGVDGLAKWQADTLTPPRMLPEVEWPFVIPESPPEPDFFDRLKVIPVKRVMLRPVGVPWFLPGELRTSRTGALPGPGVGLELAWTPTKNWRFAADLVLRAERVDADNRLHDWTPYLAPGVEFIPFPYSRRPFSIGVVTPWALMPHGKDWAGAFLFIRWTEPTLALPKPTR